MTTNELLEDLDVVKTHEMKHLEEINFEIVMLERIKNSLAGFWNKCIKNRIKRKDWNIKKENECSRKLIKRSEWIRIRL